MKKNNLILFMLLIISISEIFAYPILQPVELYPKDISGNLQPNTNFIYTFNISSDIACSNVISSQSFSLTTNKQGMGLVYLNLSNLDNEFYAYICEYKGANSTLRAKHNISSAYFNKVYANELKVYNNITSNYLIGNWNSSFLYLRNTLFAIQNLINGTNINFLKIFSTGINSSGNIELNRNNLTEVQKISFSNNTCDTSSGRTICWNNDYSTLNIVTGLGNVIQVGEEMTRTVKNTAGKIIYEGQIVSINGSSGEMETVELANAGIPVKIHNLAMVTIDSCNDNSACQVTSIGLVHDLDTSAYSEGDSLYLSADGSGNFTGVQPNFPNYNLHLGRVLRVHSSSGIISFYPEVDFDDGVTINKLGILTNLTVLGNVNVTGNITTKDTVFFSFIGDLFTRVQNLFVQNIYFNGTINGSGNIITTGNVSFKRPSATYSSTQTQTIASPGIAYPVSFNWTDDSYLIYKSSDNKNFSVGQTGKYQVILSVICQSAVAGKHIEIWIEKNDINVPRSNTLYEFKGANAEAVIAVPFEVSLNMTDKFRIMWASDDTGTVLIYKTNTSYSPETPSIIMEVSKISELT